jgi:ABC-type amino acid transport system permease subunit
LLGFEAIGAFGAALIALIANTTAYNAETLRGGINAVDRGQWDAAASLGMSRGTILRRVVLPQAFRDSLPSLGNNLVVLIKDTSLVGAITLVELTYAARNVVFQTGQAFLPFLCAAGFYLVIISLVSIGVKAWEARLQRSRQAVGETI